MVSVADQIFIIIPFSDSYWILSNKIYWIPCQVALTTLLDTEEIANITQVTKLMINNCHNSNFE